MLPTNFQYDEQSFKMFEDAVTRFGFDRVKTINWIINLQLCCKISDAALFRAIGQADVLLTILSSKNRCDIPSTLVFPLTQPQYFYLMTLLISAKMIDKSYPCLDQYLEVAQSLSQKHFVDLKRGLIR